MPPDPAKPDPAKPGPAIRDPEALKPIILKLCAGSGRARSIDPTAAARAAGGDPTDGITWRVVVRAVRQAAAELVDDGKLQVLRKGKPVDIRTVKGVIRLALPDGEP
ncbi:MAG: DUF3253 domain-containing protein [Alphaproteobacteria bacterium]|nr:DUF3253 domain-containing protein [Alphaproteobacteria bacterium]